MRIIQLYPQVQNFLRTLAPTPKKRLREALRQLSQLDGDLRELEAPLEGYHRLRVAHYRIILKIHEDRIDCIFAERRSIVYEIFEITLGSE